MFMNPLPRLRLHQPFAILLGACLTIAVGVQPLRGASLHYLSAGQPDSARLLAPPPLPDSAEQAADMATVVAVCRACSTNAASLAFGEKRFSIYNFTPALGERLKPGKLPKTEAFFDRLQKDAAAATDEAKDYWKRPRPFTVNPSLASGKLEKSFGYPSGHACEGMVLALVLADLFPDQSEAVLAIGRDLGWHRVWIGRHYPTDIYAGRVFALAIVREMKASPDFQRDLAEVKAEIVTTVANGGTRDQTPAPATR